MQAQSPGIAGLRPQYLLSKLLLVYGAKFISELVSHRLHPIFVVYTPQGVLKRVPGMGIIAILYGEIHNRTDCCPATKRQDD